MRSLLVRAMAFCALSAGIVSCGGGSAAGGNSFIITGSATIANYTCASFTVKLVDAAGNAATTATAVTVTLTGLGAGKIYATLATCRAGTALTTLTVPAGASSATVFFRSAAAASLTIQATASGIGTGSFSLTVNNFSVLGQPSPTRNLSVEQGFSAPAGLSFDGTRLFLADTNNHRVLIWSTLPTSNGTPPSIILGQTDPSVSQPATTTDATSLRAPVGVFSDGTRVFVADSANHRVLIWSTMPTSNGQAADKVLGQASFTTNGFATTATGLSDPTGVYYDGSHVFVADYANNRVLGWNGIPSSNDAAADFVLGQTDFVTNSANTGGISASTLSAPRSVSGDGTRLYVSDMFNCRVLIWNTVPTTTAAPASVVVGQADFTGQGCAASATTLSDPNGVVADSTHLYVADTNNRRLLIYSPIPTSNGASASLVLGQADFTHRVDATSQNATSNVSGVAVTPSGLMISDTGNGRLLFWSTGAIATAANASFQMGQPSFKTGNNNSGGGNKSFSDNIEDVFSDGTRVFVTDSDYNRVLVWNEVPATDGQAPDLVLGQPDFDTFALNSGSAASASTLSYPSSVFATATQLFVADRANNRVLVWNSLPTKSGQAADVVIGQPDFTTTTAAASATTLGGPNGVWSNGTRLYISDSYHRVLGYNTVPTSNGAAADFVLGQTDFVSSTSGNSATNFNGNHRIASDGTHLAIADYNNARVLVWNTLPTTTNQPADLVIGQPDFVSNTSATTKVGLAGPYGVFFAASGLMVGDYSAHRALFYKPVPSSNGAPATSVFGQPDFTSGTRNAGLRGLSGASLNNPNNVFGDDFRLWVADGSNRRVVLFPLP